MSYENSLRSITLEAGQDLSTSQYRFVSVAADGQVDPTGAGAAPDGILQNKPDAAGREALVAIDGVSLVEAGAAFNAGDDVASDSVGRAVAAGTGDVIAGTALKNAGGVGEQVSVLFHRGRATA